MNKVLLLDDRLERQKILMDDSELGELKKCEENGWLTILSELETSHEIIEAELSQYSMIAIHRSWMDDHGVYNCIEEYVKRKKKFFVVFSGGISQNLLLNNRMRLNLNAAHFYTNKLPVLIKKYAREETNHPLLELLYGESWRLALLLEYRNLLWLGGSKYNFEKDFNSREMLVNERIIEEPISMEKIEKAIEKEKYHYTLL